MNKGYEIVKNITQNVIINDYSGLASEMAYNFILSLFPFIIFAASLFGLLGSKNAIDQLLSPFHSIIPADNLILIKGILKQVVNSPSNGILGILSLLGALWAASGIIQDIIKGMNKAYKVLETRPLWITIPLSIFIVILLTLVLIITTNLIIFGSAILSFLNHYIYISSGSFNLVLLIRWPITFFALFMMIFIIYYFLPNIYKHKKQLFISSIFGSLFFCVAWLLASWGFGLYINNFAHFNLFYGAMGTVIALLVWLYYTSFIILIGGEINSEIYKLIKPETKLV